MNIFRFFGCFFKKRDKSIDFTTTDLKFIFAMAHYVHRRVLNDYIDCRHLIKENLTFNYVLDLRFEFTISSYILHKICPDKYDRCGFLSLEDCDRDYIEAVNFLYTPELLGDLRGGDVK